MVPHKGTKSCPRVTVTMPNTTLRSDTDTLLGFLLCTRPVHEQCPARRQQDLQLASELGSGPVELGLHIALLAALSLKSMGTRDDQPKEKVNEEQSAKGAYMRCMLPGPADFAACSVYALLNCAPPA